MSANLDENLSVDMQATLLLCGVFARDSSSDSKPLTLGEFNALTGWLHRHDYRCSDLIKNAHLPVPEDEPGLPEVERIRALLARGLQMAAAVERWQRLGLWVVGRDEEDYPD